MNRVGAVLLSLVALAGCGADLPGAPAPGAGSDLDRPTTLPWWDRGVLHVDGALIETRERHLVHAAGTTLVGHSSVEDGSGWWLVDGDRLVPLVESASVLWPVLAPDGGAAVWIERSGSVTPHELVSGTGEVESTVVHYDLRRRGVTDTWSTRHGVHCCGDGIGQLAVLDVGTDGRVALALLGRREMRWTPGSDPVPVPAHEAATADDRLWSPDRTAYAYLGDDAGKTPAKAALGRFWVQDLEGARIELVLPPLPEGVVANLAAWESPTTVVVEVRRPYADADDAEGGVVAFVRCDTGTGECATTIDEPGPRARLPERW